MSSDEKEMTVAFKDIDYKQDALFDGFMRIEILNNISNAILQLMTNDVVIACNKFFIIDVQHWYEPCKQEMLKDERESWIKLDSNNKFITKF